MQKFYDLFCSKFWSSIKKNNNCQIFLRIFLGCFMSITFWMTMPTKTRWVNDKVQFGIVGCLLIVIYNYYRGIILRMQRSSLTHQKISNCLCSTVSGHGVSLHCLLGNIDELRLKNSETYCRTSVIGLPDSAESPSWYTNDIPKKPSLHPIQEFSELQMCKSNT